MKSPEELYEERVNEAAQVCRYNIKGSPSYASRGFKAGVKWSNSNPSPKVMKLLEALEFYAKVYNYDNCFRSDLGTYVAANSDGTAVIEIDRGKTARESLADFKKEG